MSFCPTSLTPFIDDFSAKLFEKLQELLRWSHAPQRELRMTHGGSIPFISRVLVAQEHIAVPLPVQGGIRHNVDVHGNDQRHFGP